MVDKVCRCCLVVVAATPLVFTWLLLHVRESGFRKKLALWKPNPGNLESQTLESGIQLKEFGIPLMSGIQHPSSTDKESTIQYLESGIHGVESRIQDCLEFFWISESGNFCWWDPESWALDPGIQPKESGIPLTNGIQNRGSTYKDWNPVPGIRNPRRRIRNPRLS